MHFVHLGMLVIHYLSRIDGEILAMIIVSADNCGSISTK